MRYIFIILIFFTSNIFAQLTDCVKYIAYLDAELSHVDSAHISSNLNAIYQFDFNALSVPDELQINTGTTIYKFYVGLNTAFYPCMQHYNEFIINDSQTLDTIKIDSAISPSDFFPYCGASTNCGLVRITINLTDFCEFDWKITANTHISSQYYMCIKEIHNDYFFDTIYTKVCGTYPPKKYKKDCVLTYEISIDQIITDVPNIIPCTCQFSSDGAILFKHNPQWNLYNLSSDEYNIAVQNSTCEKKYSIVVPFSGPCEYYIPNIINKSSQNNLFCLFSRTDLPYYMRIYDRWGDLVFTKSCMTNSTGWYAENALGVYTYVITCVDKSYVGTITVIE